MAGISEIIVFLKEDVMVLRGVYLEACFSGLTGGAHFAIRSQTHSTQLGSTRTPPRCPNFWLSGSRNWPWSKTSHQKLTGRCRGGYIHVFLQPLISERRPSNGRVHGFLEHLKLASSFKKGKVWSRCHPHSLMVISGWWLIPPWVVCEPVMKTEMCNKNKRAAPKLGSCFKNFWFVAKPRFISSALWMDFSWASLGARAQSPQNTRRQKSEVFLG